MSNGHDTPALSLAVNNEKQAMIKSLVTTLDTQELMSLFCDNIWHTLRLSSLRLSDDKIRVFEQGATARHSVEYHLLVDGEDLGTLHASSRTRFSEQDLHAFESAIGELVHPLKNCINYEKAVEMALSDGLTLLGNRRSFDQRVIQSCALAQRHMQNLCLAIIDIDHFKQLNDSHGHIAGDQVLRAVADCLQSCARNSDEVFRYGGEEFVILLPHTSLTGASRFVERCRQSVAELEIAFGDKELSCSVSVGLAQLQQNELPATMLARADAAMYAAKNSGRNRVMTN